MCRPSLQAAFTLWKELGFANFTLWTPHLVTRLCAKALEAGIEVEFVQDIIRKRHLRPEASTIVGESWPWPFKIYTLGRFELVKDGEPVRFSGKVQQKPLALLKALIAFGGKDVAEEQITDALWPDADGDLAHRSFEMAVYRLRKLMGHDGIIQLQERRLTLDAGMCWVDVRALEELLSDVGKGVTEKGGKVLRNLEKAIDVYKGHFLPSDVAHPWVLSYRERLRSKFHRLIMKLGAYLEQAKQWENAAEVFQRGIEVDNRTEEFYQQLMVCYLQLGRRAEAMTVYELCRSILSSTLGISPSPRTEELYQAIKDGR
jgi:LuxR family maltose regulon positive regulatory protein